MNKEEQYGLNLKEFLNEIHWGKDKFYDNLKIMENDDCYGLKRELLKKAGEIKEDYEKDDNNFLFRDRWKDLAIVLFKMFDKNPYYKSNSNANSVDIMGILDYMDYSIKLIDDKLPDFYKYSIELHPVFQYTVMERNLIKLLVGKIQNLLSIMSKYSIEQRVELFIRLNKSIDVEVIYNQLNCYEAIEEINENRDILFKRQLYGEFQFGSLDTFIAEVLKKEIDDEFIEERINICEEKNKKRNYLNNIFDEGMTKEEKIKIDELWISLGMDEYMDMQKNILNTQEVNIKLQENKDRVLNETDINRSIDELIRNIKNSENINNKENKLNILEEIKKDIYNNEGGDESFKDISEMVIKELKYNILKRR